MEAVSINIKEKSEVILNWERTYSCFEFLNNIKELEGRYKGQKGVYMWIESVNDKTLVNYIGKSHSCLLERNIEQLYHHHSLKNSLPALYRQNRKRLIVDWLKKDMKKRDFCEFVPVHKFLTSKKFYTNTRKELNEYLQKITIYFCPLVGASDRDVQIIEAKLILSLKPLENFSGTKESRYSASKIILKNIAKDSILNFQKLIEDTEDYLKNNVNDPRPNANSLFRTR